METSKVDIFELFCKLEQRVNALEKELHSLKNGKCNENSKSRQQIVKNNPLDDYETYIEKLNAKNGNIDEILKIYDESYITKSKKARLSRFQKWLSNVMLSSVYDEKETIIPIKYSTNQFCKYSHDNQWTQLHFQEFMGHLKIIIKHIFKELTKWSELTCDKYSSEMRDKIFISITDVLTISYNDEDFEKVVKSILKKNSSY
jgi:hypothetical protein